MASLLNANISAPQVIVVDVVGQVPLAMHSFALAITAWLGLLAVRVLLVQEFHTSLIPLHRLVVLWPTILAIQNQHATFRHCRQTAYVLRIFLLVRGEQQHDQILLVRVILIFQYPCDYYTQSVAKSKGPKALYCWNITDQATVAATVGVPQLFVGK